MDDRRDDARHYIESFLRPKTEETVLLDRSRSDQPAPNPAPGTHVSDDLRGWIRYRTREVEQLKAELAEARAEIERLKARE